MKSLKMLVVTGVIVALSLQAKEVDKKSVADSKLAKATKVEATQALKITLPSALYKVEVKNYDDKQITLEVVELDGMGAMMLTDKVVKVKSMAKNVTVICGSPRLIKGLNKKSTYNFVKKKK